MMQWRPGGADQLYAPAAEAAGVHGAVTARWHRPTACAAAEAIGERNAWLDGTDHLRDRAAEKTAASGELGQRTLDLLSSSLTAQTLIKSYAGRLSQFAEFCHDSENISPLEATTATVVRYVAWIGERGHIGASKPLQPYMSAINTFFELHNLDPIAKDSLHLTSVGKAWADAAAAPCGSRPALCEFLCLLM
eukprot:jgi/Tetstr1/431750/TSEL_002238.t1